MLRPEPRFARDSTAVPQVGRVTDNPRGNPTLPRAEHWRYCYLTDPGRLVLDFGNPDQSDCHRTMTTRQRSFKAMYSPLGSIAMLLFVSVAAGKPTDSQRAEAQRLFDEAMYLMQNGQYQTACARFEASQRLAPAIGNQFNLAECYEKTGRIASAWTNFTDVADAAQKRGEARREQIARKRAEDVAPRLSYVTTEVTSPSAGMRLQLDISDLAQDAWGKPIPVDVGTHVIRASAPGRLAWSKTVEVVGEGVTIGVEVPALVVVPRVGPAGRLGNGSTVAPRVEPTSQPAAWPYSSQRVWALVSAGVGVVGLGVGAAMVVAAENKQTRAVDYCKGSDCWDTRGSEALHDAKRLGDWANLPFGIGLAGLGLGAALWFTATTSSGETSKTSVSVSPNGVLLRGRF